MERFNFTAAYDAVIDPEFPGDGDWGCPVYWFDRDGQVVEEFRSTWGRPLVVEVTTSHGHRWIGMFAAGGLGGVTGLYATPGRDQLCVVADGLAYLVDVGRPDGGSKPIKWQVHQVAAVDSEPILLVVGMIDITAVGSEGVLWESTRLALDGLMVETMSGNVITCSLDNLGGTPTITLDAVTGRQLTWSQVAWPSDGTGRTDES